MQCILRRYVDISFLEKSNRMNFYGILTDPFVERAPTRKADGGRGGGSGDADRDGRSRCSAAKTSPFLSSVRKQFMT